MLKHREIHHPDSCLNRARPDEPIFVLRANDPCAAATVAHWASIAPAFHEPEKVEAARRFAREMAAWRQAQLQPPPAAAVDDPEAPEPVQ